ncbi:MAG: hypothetical protein ACI86H_000513 [bacterium]|jgi:hypothetical protein
MLNSTLIITLLLCIGITTFVIAVPLFIQKPTRYFHPEEIPMVFDTSIATLEVITELQSDYEMGKLTKEEFEHLSLEYQRKYLEEKQSN